MASRDVEQNSSGRAGSRGVDPQQGRVGSRGPDLHYGHPRMSLSDRAKIFMPFNPLRGFTEALRAEEERHERELQEGGQG